MAEGNGACSSEREAADERLLVRALELALEQAVEFRVLRCLLAVRDSLRIRLIGKNRVFNIIERCGTMRGEWELTVLRGCCAKICANLIMSASLLRVFARSIIASAESCCSQGPAAARRVVKAVTETGLHFSPPPAASCEWRGETVLSVTVWSRYVHKPSPIAQWSLK